MSRKCLRLLEGQKICVKGQISEVRQLTDKCYLVCICEAQGLSIHLNKQFHHTVKLGHLWVKTKRDPELYNKLFETIYFYGLVYEYVNHGKVKHSVREEW